MNNVGLPGILTGILMIAVFAVVFVLPWYKLWKRTGHNGWIGLLMLLPFVNIIMLYVLAFKKWPALSDRNK